MILKEVFDDLSAKVPTILAAPRAKPIVSTRSSNIFLRLVDVLQFAVISTSQKMSVANKKRSGALLTASVRPTVLHREVE